MLRLVSQPIEKAYHVARDDLTREQAYRKGWDASKRSTTYDLGAAEDRFEAFWGREHSGAFSDGWIDHASGYAYDYHKGV